MVIAPTSERPQLSIVCSEPAVIEEQPEQSALDRILDGRPDAYSGAIIAARWVAKHTVELLRKTHQHRDDRVRRNVSTPEATKPLYFYSAEFRQNPWNDKISIPNPTTLSREIPKGIISVLTKASRFPVTVPDGQEFPPSVRR